MNYLKYSIWCGNNELDMLQGNINSNGVVIVGLSWCPWTIRAKKLVKEKIGVDPVMVLPDLVNNDYKIRTLYCLSKLTNTHYTPQIWIDQKHIGDFEHLYKLVSTKY